MNDKKKSQNKNPLAPPGVVNGQPNPAMTLSQDPSQKISKWRYFFILIGLLQVSGVALFFTGMIWAIQQAKAGVSGTEFIALLLFITLVPALGVVSLINLIGLPIYMYKYRPKNKRLVLAILSLALSLLLVLYAAYNIYQIRVAVPNQYDDLSEQYKPESDKVQQLGGEHSSVTTKAEALALMQSCKVDYFVGQTVAPSGEIKESDKNTRQWLAIAENSSTGISVSDSTSVTYVFASKSATAELQDTVRQFRHDCYVKKKLYLTVDDWIETEYPKGVWTRVNR